MIINSVFINFIALDGDESERSWRGRNCGESGRIFLFFFFFLANWRKLLIGGFGGRERVIEEVH